MKLLLTPSSLRGTVTVPPSKSLLHRELICRFLAGQVTELPPHAAQDVLATYRGLACLTAPAPLVDCGDSGSTLRFLLPLFMALGRTDAVFTGSDRLLSRPIPGDLGLRRTEQGLALTRPLTAGHWSLPGDETSQLISGMLLALPLLPGDSDITVTVEGNEVHVARPTDQPRHRSMHGLYRALIHNMVVGVSKGYEIKQELVGVGFKAEAKGQILELSLGYSHDIFVQLPPEIKVEAVTEKKGNPIVTLKSIDKQLIGQVAAKIRSLRKPEPYKGKGIKFVGEQLRRKAGKSANAK